MVLFDHPTPERTSRSEAQVEVKLKAQSAALYSAESWRIAWKEGRSRNLAVINFHVSIHLKKKKELATENNLSLRRHSLVTTRSSPKEKLLSA